MSSQVGGVTPLNQKNNQIYEVAAYRNKIVNWRNKIETDLNEVLQVQDVFTNVARGLVASKHDLLRGFDTTDKEVICKEILEKGDFQVSELERKSLLEGMFRDVASIVVEKSYNTDTGRAYSMSMIQNAMKDIHYSVNLSKGAKQQALDVIRRLKKVMPIARTKLCLRITSPAIHTEEVEAMLIANAAEIVKRSSTSVFDDSQLTASNEENMSTDQNKLNPSISVVEVKINPENFRMIQDLTASITKGKGILEIVHQQQEVSVESSKGDDNGNEDNMDRVTIISQDEQKKGRNSTSARTLESEKGDDDESEVVFFMAKSNKGKNKKKKKEKKLAKIHQMSMEKDSDSSDRGDDDNDCNEGNTQPALSTVEDDINLINNDSVNMKKQAKKSKRNKRMEKEIQKELDKSEMARAERLEALESGRLAGKLATTQLDSTSMAGNSGNFKCNTCSAVFGESAAHRAHFKSDWHRINLKRKLQKLPLVASEEEFYSVPVDYWDCNIDDHT